jgi:hypothetical protein
MLPAGGEELANFAVPVAEIPSRVATFGMLRSDDVSVLFSAVRKLISIPKIVN